MVRIWQAVGLCAALEPSLGADLWADRAEASTRSGPSRCQISRCPAARLTGLQSGCWRAGESAALSAGDDEKALETEIYVRCCCCCRRRCELQLAPQQLGRLERAKRATLTSFERPLANGPTTTMRPPDDRPPAHAIDSSSSTGSRQSLRAARPRARSTSR